MEKYLDFAGELKKLWNMYIIVILPVSVFISWIFIRNSTLINSSSFQVENPWQLKTYLIQINTKHNLHGAPGIFMIEGDFFFL